MFIKWLADNSLILLLSLGTVFTFVWLLVLKDRLRVKWYAALVLSVLHTVFGVLSVKLFAIIEGFGDPDAVGNMSLFGGIFFMPLVYFLGSRITKRSTSQVFDIFTPCMIFTVMCARVNCIVSGCCLGLYIPGTEHIRWPTRELEIILYAVLLLILCPKIYKGKSSGEIYPLYMACYGAFRFVIEFFRVSGQTAGIFHLSHIWAALSFILGLSIYFEIKNKNKNKKVRR